MTIFGLAKRNSKDRIKQNLGPVSNKYKVNQMNCPIFNMFHIQVKNVIRNEKTVLFEREQGVSQIYEEVIVQKKVDTVTKAFNFAVSKYGDRPCVGTREILGEEDETQSNGKVMEIS